MSDALSHQKIHLHLDVVGGIAGDMFCAAMLDAWPVHTQPLLNVLQKILPSSCGTPKVWADKNAGMHVQRFALIEVEPQPESKKAKATDKAVKKTESKTIKETVTPTHSHSHTHPSHDHDHDHTTFIALKKRIEQSQLTKNIADIAVRILTILAHAEAKMHATTIEQVHFHELADWDSLMDVVAAAFLIDAVNPQSVSFSDLPLGRGLVKTQHGLLPVPAPATTEILKGFTCRDDGIKGERITPTGAAILRYLHTHLTVKRITQAGLLSQGYGGGSRNLEGMPNLLRLAFFTGPNSLVTVDTVMQIECDIDDMTPEEIALACDILRETQGVIDVTVSALRGKKNRLVERVGLLCDTAYQDAICDAVFAQTATLGVRITPVTRKILPREPFTAHRQGQVVQGKQATRPTGNITRKIESDNLKAFSTLAQRRAVKRDTE